MCRNQCWNDENSCSCRVDHLAVQTLVYTPSTNICQLIYDALSLRKFFYFYFIFIANLTHVVNSNVVSERLK